MEDVSPPVIRLLVLSLWLSVIGASPSSRACGQLPATRTEIERLLVDVWNPDEAVRVHAAQRLFELGDPHALAANLMTIDDDPGSGNASFTPAVTALGAIGKAALPGLYELLDAPSELTRRRAWSAVLLATQKVFGRDTTRGWPPDGSEYRYESWISSIDYRPDGTRAARIRAIHRLRSSHLP